jgi:hypothetical protein
VRYFRSGSVVRALVICSLLGALCAAPAHAASAAERQLLMPGVTYERQVQFTSHGPVAIHVLSAPRPGGLWGLEPVLSQNAILGAERVTEMQKQLAPSATVAGVNGDLFALLDSRPSGILMRDGVLDATPHRDRSSTGIAPDGTLHVDRVQMFGTWRGNGQRRPVLLNTQPGPNGIALLTPAWGPTTPTYPSSLEAVIGTLPPTRPNLEHAGAVVEHRAGTGGGPIPPGGAVLVARGTSAQRLAAEAPVGTTATLRFVLTPSWSGIVDAIGGGPALVRDGKPVFRHFELFSTSLRARNPRTAVGQRADGRILLVVVDGRRPGYSVGMTYWELAQTLVRLGAVTGSGLDSGGSSTMAFDGALLNRPSDVGGERPVSEGLFVVYTGVHAPAPAEPVLSPNGDGVAETQSLAYKVVRPSTVTVSLVGPDRVARRLESGPKPPGVYPLTWAGVTADGAPEPEGDWRFSVTAVDESGQSSTADRLFSLNRTLAGLVVAPPIFAAGSGTQLRAGFTLTRAADVTITVETPTGAVVATPIRAERREAGTHAAEWDGSIGTELVHNGRYVLRVAARNEVGSMSLGAPFTVRRAGRG